MPKPDIEGFLPALRALQATLSQGGDVQRIAALRQKVQEFLPDGSDLLVHIANGRIEIVLREANDYHHLPTGMIQVASKIVYRHPSGLRALKDRDGPSEEPPPLRTRSPQKTAWAHLLDD